VGGAREGHGSVELAGAVLAVAGGGDDQPSASSPSAVHVLGSRHSPNDLARGADPAKLSDRGSPLGEVDAATDAVGAIVDEIA
jgi:hypothetical protein